MPTLHRGFVDTVRAYQAVHEEDPYLQDPETMQRLEFLESRMSMMLERLDEAPPVEEGTDAA